MRKILISLTILSSLSSAFTFDLWSSKITLNEAIQISKKALLKDANKF